MIKTVRAALYARVSTTDQTCDNQLHELRRYAEARGWTTTEYVDTGISGAKDRRPALDQLMADVAARRVDAVVCWRLDRFGRNLRHLVVAIEELAAVAVAFVSIGESIDTTSPTGRLMLGVLGAFARFERERIRERVHAGLARARREGTRLGRKRERIPERDIERTLALSVREAATVLGVPPSRVHRERARLFQNPSRLDVPIPEGNHLETATL
jgi:DNA invertase Pin-like site-specific DNA recombinase